MSNRRILCITSNFPRWEGDSTTPFVLHLAEDLQALGWRVDVLAPHAPGAARHERIGGVKVERFRYLWPARLETVCYQGGALSNLAHNRGNYLKLPPLVFFEWATAVRRLMRGRYDLLHSHWILPQGFTGVLAAKPLRLPHVLTVHGGDAFALRGRILSKFKRFSLAGADAVTVNSSATREQILSIAPGIPEPKSIPMG
ncbi:MAG: glycosyltransferase, partial [Gammaproteobacteria bacterium]|nr:glycosyltransferase [Gammaproteobacteria bacterium]